MPTDTSEKGLERLICKAMTGHPCGPWRIETGGVAGTHGLNESDNVTSSEKLIADNIYRDAMEWKK